MNTILDGLTKYFQANSREKIQEVWDSLAEYDEVGVKVDDFVENHLGFLDQSEPLSFYWKPVGQVVENPTFSDFFIFSVKPLFI